MSSFLGTLAAAGLGYMGQQQTNSANAYMNYQNLMFQNYAMQQQQGFNRESQMLGQDFAYGMQQNSQDYNANQQRIAQEFAAGQQLSQQGFNWGAQQEAQRFGRESQDHAQWFAADQANLARRWEAHMSNSAYQRATADMRAAGINPMLAYMQGGASTPNSPSPAGSPASGGMASSGMGSAGMASSSPGSAGIASSGLPGGSTAVMHNALGAAVNSGLDFYRTYQTMERTQAETQQVKAQTEVANANVHNINASTQVHLMDALVKKGIPAVQAADIVLKHAQARYQSAGAANLSADTQLKGEDLKSIAEYGGKISPVAGWFGSPPPGQIAATARTGLGSVNVGAAALAPEIQKGVDAAKPDLGKLGEYARGKPIIQNEFLESLIQKLESLILK